MNPDLDREIETPYGAVTLHIPLYDVQWAGTVMTAGKLIINGMLFDVHARFGLVDGVWRTDCAWRDQSGERRMLMCSARVLSITPPLSSDQRSDMLGFTLVREARARLLDAFQEAVAADLAAAPYWVPRGLRIAEREWLEQRIVAAHAEIATLREEIVQLEERRASTFTPR